MMCLDDKVDGYFGKNKLQDHRRNHPMGPVGRIPSIIGDRWDKAYLDLVRSNLYN